MADIERLMQLRRVIEAAPEDRLHMRRWSEVGPCGTAYCAAGWAAVDPWFREHTDIDMIFEVTRDGMVKESWDCAYDPFPALASLFDISQEDAGHLFGGDLQASDDPHAVRKDEVLENIDRIIAGNPAKRYAFVEAMLDVI